MSRIQKILSKCSFSKFLSPGKNWKSKSTRIIPEEFLRNTHGTIEHRVVFSVPWNNSWQLWLHLEKEGLFMIEEDWDEFVDDNLLGPDDILVFIHQDTMYFELRIFKKDGKEILSPPLKVEPETEPHYSHQETPTPASASASGRKTGRGRPSCAHVENPKQYLFNPKNPYFEKTLTKTNHVLYVSSSVIDQYGLEFGPRNSSMYFLLPDGKKLEGFTKCYGGGHSFLGWAAVCQNYNLKLGDTVVCEFELSGRVIMAVRVHFVNKAEPVHPEPHYSHQETTTPASAFAEFSASGSRGRQSCAHVKNPKRYLSNPKNPYFEKTLTKTNYILYVSSSVLDQYGMELGPRNSTMYFLLPDGKKLEGFAKYYGGSRGFLGWANVCQNYNLKLGDTVVCEFELSGRVITAVRVHFVNK